MNDAHNYLDMEEAIHTKGKNLEILNNKSGNIIILK